MFTPDIPTVSLLVWIIAAMSMIAMWGLWRTFPHRSGLEQWFQAALLNTLSLGCLFAGVLQPEVAALPQFAGHLLAAVSLLCLLEGVLRFHGSDSDSRWKLIFVLAPYLAWLLWIFNASALARTLLQDVLTSVLLLSCAVVILQQTPHRRAPGLHALLAVFCLLPAAANLLRAVLHVQQMRYVPLPAGQGLSVIPLLAMMISHISFTGTAALLCHRGAQDQAEQLRRADALTGLPNRRSLEETLSRQIALARRSHGRFGVIGIDLEQLRQVSEEFGQTRGNLLLQAMARKLRECTRESDVAGRLEEDEFLVIVGGLTRPDDAQRAIERLQRDLGGDVECDGVRHSFRILAGLAVWPEDGRTAQDLIRRADHRVYEFKQRCLAAAAVV